MPLFADLSLMVNFRKVKLMVKIMVKVDGQNHGQS